MYIQTIRPEKVGREGVCLQDRYLTQGQPVNHNTYTDTMGGVNKICLLFPLPRRKLLL